MSTPRKQAAKAGNARYEGRPCQHCGGTERYVLSASCVACTNRKRKESYQRLRDERNAAMAAKLDKVQP